MGVIVLTHTGCKDSAVNWSVVCHSLAVVQILRKRQKHDLPSPTHSRSKPYCTWRYI